MDFSEKSQLNVQKIHHDLAFQIKPVKTSQGDIYPARGVVKTKDGKVVLTAYATNKNNQDRIPSNILGCQ